LQNRFTEAQIMPMGSITPLKTVSFVEFFYIGKPVKPENPRKPAICS